jgi:hypothetical protein
MSQRDCDFGGLQCHNVAQELNSNPIVINILQKSDFGFLRAIHRAGVKAMSLRKKVIVFALAALVAVGGLSFALTNAKHASILVASAVWGS